MIAHRISTVKSADLVVVLEQGRVTQIGTHDELMAEHGHYREIARVQLSADPSDLEQPSHMKRVQNPHEVRNAKPVARREKAEPTEQRA